MDILHGEILGEAKGDAGRGDKRNGHWDVSRDVLPIPFLNQVSPRDASSSLLSPTRLEMEAAPSSRRAPFYFPL